MVCEVCFLCTCARQEGTCNWVGHDNDRAVTSQESAAGRQWALVLQRRSKSALPCTSTATTLETAVAQAPVPDVTRRRK